VSAVFTTVCLDNFPLEELADVPLPHTPPPDDSDQRLSVHLHLARGFSVWGRQAEKFRALAQTLTAAADALDAANVARVEEVRRG
jgi:hypothetical protein